MEQGQENAVRDAEEGGQTGAVIGAVVVGAASAAAVDFVEKQDAGKQEQGDGQEEDVSAAERLPVCGRQVQPGLHAYERE